MPVLMPVTLGVGDTRLDNVEVPAITDQLPVPKVCVIAVSDPVTEQTVWLAPALAIGLASLYISTVSLALGQTPFAKSHKIVLVPVLSEETVVVAEVVLKKEPPPVSNDQVPVPRVCMIAPSVVVEAQTV